VNNNITKYKKKFFVLLEAKSGNIKPIVFEDQSQTQPKGLLKNFVYKLRNSNSKIKNWIKNTFGKENPTEQEVESKLKENPPQIQNPLTPTTSSQPSPLPDSPILDAIPTNMNENYLNEDLSNYFEIWNKKQQFLLKNLNWVITTYLIPEVNKQIQTEISKLNLCFDLYIDEICIPVTVKITGFKVDGIYLWDGNATNKPNWTLIGMSVSCTVYINAAGIELYVYPTAVEGAAIFKNELISFSSPDISITTSLLDVGVAYVWLENNKLKVSNSFLGTKSFDLGLNEKLNSVFKGKIINIKKELPNLYNTTL